jgi:hypothetical protein
MLLRHQRGATGEHRCENQSPSKELVHAFTVDRAPASALYTIAQRCVRAVREMKGWDEDGADRAYSVTVPSACTPRKLSRSGAGDKGSTEEGSSLGR